MVVRLCWHPRHGPEGSEIYSVAAMMPPPLMRAAARPSTCSVIPLSRTFAGSNLAMPSISAPALPLKIASPTGPPGPARRPRTPGRYGWGCGGSVVSLGSNGGGAGGVTGRAGTTAPPAPGVAPQVLAMPAVWLVMSSRLLVTLPSAPIASSVLSLSIAAWAATSPA